MMVVSRSAIRSGGSALLCVALALGVPREAAARETNAAPERDGVARLLCGEELLELGYRSAASPIWTGDTVRVIALGESGAPETFDLLVEQLHDDRVVGEVIEAPATSLYTAPAVGQRLDIAASCIAAVPASDGASTSTSAPSPLRAPDRPRTTGFHVGVGPVRWADDTSSRVTATSAVIGSLQSAGIAAAPVLHPADAPVFLTGELGLRAHENIPSRDGTGSLVAGSLLLVAGISGGVTVGLFVDPEIGAGSGVGVSGLGVLLVAVGAALRARHRRKHTVEWSASGVFVVRARGKEARTAEIHRSGERRCESRKSCLESILAAEQDARGAISDALGQAVRGATRHAGGGL